jgi:hypothetical protein
MCWLHAMGRAPAISLQLARTPTNAQLRAGQV